MPLWEYMVVVLGDGAAAIQAGMMAHHGRNGWELVAVTPGPQSTYLRLIFKRPLMEPAK